MEGKNSNQVSNIGTIVDVSSFLVVEGSADSSDQVDQEDCGLFKVCFDEDDAESCCYDTTMISDHDTFDCCDDDDDDDDEDCCDRLTDSDDKRWIRRKLSDWGGKKLWLGGDCASELECRSELEGGDEGKPIREVMDQMEDRLFWETCMAVGYP